MSATHFRSDSHGLRAKAPEWSFDHPLASYADVFNTRTHDLFYNIQIIYVIQTSTECVCFTVFAFIINILSTAT